MYSLSHEGNVSEEVSFFFLFFFPQPYSTASVCALDSI